MRRNLRRLHHSRRSIQAVKARFKGELLKRCDACGEQTPLALPHLWSVNSNVVLIAWAASRVKGADEQRFDDVGVPVVRQI